MTFEELVSALNTEGYTRTHNTLDDLLLRELPSDYYCVWRYIWRELFGKHLINFDNDEDMEQAFSLRTIAAHTRVGLNNISRPLWFFHVAGLIEYAPGNQTTSRFRLLPNGLPDLDELNHRIRTLIAVLGYESAQTARNRHFRFKINEFLSKLSSEWNTRKEMERECQSVQ